MQQPSRALKRFHSVIIRPQWAVAVVAVAIGLSGCGASWTGTWGGVADLGPVDAHELTLTLSDKDSTVTLKDANGDTKTLQVCARSVENRKITLVVDMSRPDCSTGANAKRLRLDGLIGAGVIHGDMYRGQQRVGFFRAFRASLDDVPQGGSPAPLLPKETSTVSTPSPTK